ncbi:nuclear transport factor 2 family protein [Pseudomonas sp. TWI672]|uniref:nuclear transport factor 2 family protein n=1 Tax=unclassified Pseudomonas TaxID=196821 RepID=UPI003208CE7C
MSNENQTVKSREIALDYLSRVSSGDIDKALELLSSDAKVWFPDKGHMNREELRDILKYAKTCFVDRIALVPYGVTAEGERVAVEVKGDAALKSGAAYDNKYHFLFIVKDGLITDLREYLDTIPAQKAFWS